MAKRYEILGIVCVAALCFLLIAFSQKEPQTFNRPMRYQAFDLQDEEAEVESPTVPMQEVVRRQKNLIRQEMYHYRFEGNRTVESYTPATGGRPLRAVIVTTWRSGSTFLGDVINSVPGNYYHYEPLLDYGIVQIRGAPYARSALKVLKSLLECEYADLQEYLQYGMQHVYLFTHNTRLWNQCEVHSDYCWNATFLNQFCRLFPFQSMKTVRLRLWLAEELLKDERLNVKIIHLVRDPRGTLQSRKHRDWCPGQPDCEQPEYLCSDMVSDYSAAIQLQKRYPKRFRALRYEDLSLEPYETVKALFDFLGLHYHNNVKHFLDSHTRINVGGVSSTFRDSKSAPFHWKSDLNYTEIQTIETACEEAMKLWGYVRSPGPNMKDFNPLTAYEIN